MKFRELPLIQPRNKIVTLGGVLPVSSNNNPTFLLEESETTSGSARERDLI
jgi:hypothetical protein